MVQKHIMIKWILIVTLYLGTLHTAAQQNIIDSTFSAQISEARKKIDSLKNIQDIPGISVAVGFQGKIIWAEGFGFSDRAKKERVSLGTKFRVGSISKSMTALALAKLFDQGKIHWDDTVSKYLPHFCSRKPPFTLRQLAGHQAGIRHYRGFEFLSKKQYNSVKESMDVFQNDKLLFEPGTDYTYSTYGYVVLSRIIEVVSKQDYLDFMSQEIFDPIGMVNTVAENAKADESKKAIFYGKRGRKVSREVNMSNKWAGGGFLSTPSDLVKMINHATKIISVPTLFTLITPQKLTSGKATDYGMGFRISVAQSTNHMIVHHGGKSAGARAFLLALPDEQVVVAICTNAEADYNAQEVYDIAKIFVN